MVERRNIIEQWRKGNALALATLVRVEGSSYRREGARLLLGADGSYVGSISGGCLEAEIVRKGEWLTRSGATVQRYSTAFDDTAEIPFGLGCGGTVDVLIEPADTPEFEALMNALAGSLAGQRCTVTTRLPEAGRQMAREIRAGQGKVLFRTEQLHSNASGQFEEEFEPPQTLFVCGAGDDAKPLVRMGALLGWSVFVLDARPQWATAHRFPEAEQVAVSQGFAARRPQAEDAVILMTHSYQADRDWLREVLPMEPRYVGILGSRHRSAVLISEVAAMLGWTVARACEHVFAPVGLDLGGDGPEAVALSAVSEVQACFQGGLVRSRHLTAHDVSEQIALGGPSRFLQAQCAL